jgi:hypothetical protein
MNEIAAPLVRVLLRYAGAGLMTKAGVSIDLTDPDVMVLAEFVIGGLLSVAAEGWWALARKKGWGQ